MKKTKSHSKTNISKICAAFGMKLEPGRMTLKDGTRAFVVRSSEKDMAFKSMADLRNWLYKQLNSKHDSVNSMINKSTE